MFGSTVTGLPRCCDSVVIGWHADPAEQLPFRMGWRLGLRRPRWQAVCETGYRSIAVASQSISWVVGQALKLRFAVEAHRLPGPFEHGREHRLILAPTHQTVLDPWLIMGALRYRQWRALVPVRALASRTFRRPLKWFTPLIRVLYWFEGVVELPPKEEGGTVSEKVQGLLDARAQGDAVAIFPEGARAIDTSGRR